MRSNDTVGPDQKAVFDLLCRCALEPADGAGSIDSKILLKQARRHGLLPLAKRNYPDSLALEDLESVDIELRESSARGLHLAGELSRLIAHFEEAGIKAAPYKGPTLAAEAYGNLSLRSYCDLDVLIDRKDLAEAEKTLIGNGYIPELKLEGSRREHWLNQNCELNFNSADGLCHIEIHWAPLPPRFGTAFNLQEMLGRLRTVSVSGKPIPSLAPEDLLLVLCAHGFKHFWRRLFWIADLARLLRAHPDLDWSVTLERAERWRTRRMLLLGTALANRLLGTRLPNEIIKRIEADPKVASLAQQSERWLQADWEAPRSGITEARYALSGGETFSDRGPMWQHLVGRALRPNDRDRATVKLPRFLNFLYWLIRPFRLFRDYGLRGHSRQA